MFHGAVSIRFYVFQPHWEPLQIALPRLKYFTELRNLKYFILKTSWNWPDFFVTLRVYCAWELASAELLFSKSQNDKVGHKGQKLSYIMLNASCKNSSANHHANPHAKRDFMVSLKFWPLMTFKALDHCDKVWSIQLTSSVAHTTHSCIRMGLCAEVLRL